MRKGDIYLAILFLFFTTLIYFLLISPKNNQVSGLRFLVKQKEAEFLNFAKYFQQIKEISRRFENYKEEISKIEQAIPDNPNLSLFLDFVQKSSSASGLSLTKIDSVDRVDKEKIKDWKIKLSFTGNYDSLKNFLKVLEKSSRLIRVEKISFSTPEKGENFEIGIVLIISSK